jgi:DNA-binding GntR family transcriptional regulator
MVIQKGVQSPQAARDETPADTSAARAYEIIKHKIITLEMAPGSAIHESALAEELNLGRTPIREALRLLQSEKLVTTVPRRGMFVSNVSITDLQQIAEVRIQLEGLAARLAAERATPEEIELIEEHCVQAERSPESDPRRVIHTDRRLHLLIAQASHNEYLTSEVDRYYSLSLRLWHLALARVQTADLDVGVHRAVMQAIKARDPERAESLMQEHIRNFHRAIRSAM